MNEEAREINKWLKETYGQTVEGHPIFRVAWTSDLTEKVHDTFKDFYGPLVLREVTETREVPKYPFMKDRFVLEKIELLPESSEIKLSDARSTKFSYECIYAFQTKNGSYLPLHRGVIEIILHFYLNKIRTTPEMLDDERKAQDEKERDYYRQKIGELQSVPHLMDLVY